MPTWSTYSFLFGPVVALLSVGLLIGLLKWAFPSKPTSLVAPRPRAGRDHEYGLLVPVASPGNYITGEMIRRELEEAGVRANLTRTLDGPRVMVFGQDVDRANEVLSRR